MTRFRGGYLCELQTCFQCRMVSWKVRSMRDSAGLSCSWRLKTPASSAVGAASPAQPSAFLVKRFEQSGAEGLTSRSKRPHRLPASKVTAHEEQWILELRQRRLGSRRIQSELLRLHGCALARRTIQKVLTKLHQPPLKSTRRARKVVKRYSREVPGERVQFDTCEIAEGLCQYTAIDERHSV